MIQMNWHETQAEPKIWNAQYQGRLFEIAKVEEDYHVAEITNGYAFLGAKAKMRHAKRLVEGEFRKSAQMVIHE